jgi:hypothetical protein
LGENFQFGGGDSASFMSPVVLALTILAVVAVLFLPKKYAFAAILAGTFLTPFGQQLYFLGAHLFVIRILVLAGLARWLMKGKSEPSPFEKGFTTFEKIFFLWAFARAVAFILFYRQVGAVGAQLSFLLEACGGYIVFRHFLGDEKDVTDALKSLAAVMCVLSVCMLYEYLTRVNLFSYMNSVPINPWIRDGKVRAQGVFANSITAGAFGAVFLPLFYWIWKSKKARLFGAVGIASASIIALTSMASTAVSAYLAAVLGLCLWPIRKRMRSVRWGIVLLLGTLALVMKAPVWYIIARIDFVGGHGWDRAFLVEQFVNHFSEWWLLGSNNNGSWGNDTWDACNQFVAEGLAGGLATFLLFITIVKRGFGMIGERRRQVQGDPSEWFFWCLGVSLFSNVVAFWGIDYFDQTRTMWFIFLAIISAATTPLLAARAAEIPDTAALPAAVRSSLYPLPLSPRSTPKTISLRNSRQSRS